MTDKRIEIGTGVLTEVTFKPNGVAGAELHYDNEVRNSTFHTYNITRAYAFELIERGVLGRRVRIIETGETSQVELTVLPNSALHHPPAEIAQLRLEWAQLKRAADQRAETTLREGELQRRIDALTHQLARVRGALSEEE